MTELEVAINVITVYLSSSPSVYNVNELYEIRHGNAKKLKEHIDALKSIFEKASEEFELKMKVDTNDEQSEN